jgi:hypothetical protein
MNCSARLILSTRPTPSRRSVPNGGASRRTTPARGTWSTLGASISRRADHEFPNFGTIVGVGTAPRLLVAGGPGQCDNLPTADPGAVIDETELRGWREHPALVRGVDEGHGALLTRGQDPSRAAVLGSRDVRGHQQGRARHVERTVTRVGQGDGAGGARADRHPPEVDGGRRQGGDGADQVPADAEGGGLGAGCRRGDRIRDRDGDRGSDRGGGRRSTRCVRGECGREAPPLPAPAPRGER